MRFVRAILAFAVAVSLAMLPVGASAAGLAMSSDDMQPGVEQSGMREPGMSMTGHAGMSMDDCCPDGEHGAASHTDSHKCGMGFCCVGGAIALGDIQPLAFEFLAAGASKTAIPADQVVSFRGGSPPFRPPRI